MIATSYGEHRILLSIFQKEIIFEHVPEGDVFKNCDLIIVDEFGNMVSRKNCSELPRSYEVPTMRDGLYYLVLEIKSLYDNKPYYYLEKGDVPFRFLGGTMAFLHTEILENNYKFLSNLISNEHIRQQSLETSYMINWKDRRIYEFAHSLTETAEKDIEKIKSVHVWVSRTLYYDNDSIDSGSYKLRGNSATDVFNNTIKCVCQGFTHLTVALLRAVGIPSLALEVYAIHPSVGEKWEKANLEAERGNHEIPIAWTGDRWLIMDPTWDCDNYYKDKQYQGRHGKGFPYKYFDNTVAFISNTHRFIKVLDF